MRLLLAGVSVLWIAFEVYLFRTRQSTAANNIARDPTTLPLIWMAIAGGITAGFVVQRAGGPRLPLGETTADGLGIALIVAGLVLRGVAIRTLGRFFTVDVVVDRKHEIVENGLYRFVRHPAYDGCLLSFAGLALTMRTWAGVVCCFVPILAAFLHRILIEERLLSEGLGEAWAGYAGRTSRLVPGIW